MGDSLLGVLEGGLYVDVDSIDQGALFYYQIVEFLVDGGQFVDGGDQVIDFSIF